MATRTIAPEPTGIAGHSARPAALRPDEAIRHLAADLEKVSNVVVQTEALGWKMVELSQSLAHIEPAVNVAAGHVAESNRRMSETSDRVLGAVEIMEMAQRQTIESLSKRLNTLTGLLYWALGLGSCAVAVCIIELFTLFTRTR
jgi:hypothetical protein